jgi:integrase
MTKRANGEGSIYRDGNRWRGVLSIYQGPGIPPRKVKVSGQTKKDVAEKLQDLRRRHGMGDRFGPKPTVKAFMATWLPIHRSGVAPTTADRDERTARLYFGEIEDIRIDRLRYTDVDRLLIGIQARGLSPRTAQMVRTLLRTAMGVAVRDGLLAVNPVTHSTPPQVPEPDPKHLSVEQVAALLERVETDPLGASVHLLLRTGARRGEALGLCWSDVDLVAGTIQIRRSLSRIKEGDGWVLHLRQPKTSRSRRWLDLSPKMVEILQAHYTAQVERSRLGLRPFPGPDSPVFSTAAGGFVDPDGYTKWLAAHGKAIGLHVHPHACRHTYAVHLLNGGAIDVSVVSSLMGHATVSLTSKIYSHVQPETRRSAAVVLDDVYAARSVAPKWIPSEIAVPPAVVA